MAAERFYDAIVIGAGPVPSAQLRGAGGSREVAPGVRRRTTRRG
jgi:hypothetical protein